MSLQWINKIIKIILYYDFIYWLDFCVLIQPDELPELVEEVQEAFEEAQQDLDGQDSTSTDASVESLPALPKLPTLFHDEEEMDVEDELETISTSKNIKHERLES